MIVRETEWDDETRQRALDLAAYEDSLCPCGCGKPAAETLKPFQAYRVHKTSCASQRAIDYTRRQMAEANKENPGWDDGLLLYAELDPEASAKAAAMAAEKATTKTKTKRPRGSRGR